MCSHTALAKDAIFLAMGTMDGCSTARDGLVGVADEGDGGDHPNKTW